MAVTKIWKVRGNVGTVIDYADNPEKVAGAISNEDLEDVLGYADDDIKTENHAYTTAINCTREYAKQEFELVKELFDKEGGTVALHAYQSFEENISPREAHEIGVQMAKELWGDKFQVIVATHLNTDHVHNHFVINSVSFVDGKRFHTTNYSWLDMVRVSDRLCKEHGLSVIEKTQGKRIPYNLYMREKNGDPVRYNVARDAIDYAVKRSLNMEEFKAELRTLGYSFQFDQNRKYWTVTVPGWERPIRTNRLGSEYTRDRIIERIYSNDESVRTNKYREAYYHRPNNYHMRRRIHRINTRTGLEKLYLRVCYEMGYLPKYRQEPLKVHYIFRDELIRCDVYGREASLLSKNHVSTVDDLRKLQTDKANEINDLMSRRTELRKMAKRNIPEEQREALKDKITDLTDQIKRIRSELKLIDDIADRSGTLEEKVKEVDRERNGKELIR